MDRNFCFKCYVLSAILTTTIGQSLRLQCQDGWTLGYERCYLVVTIQRTWKSASSYCNKYGAKLAEPAGYEINSWLASQWSSSPVKKFWIGYNRIDLISSDGSQGYWSDKTNTDVSVGVWGDFQPGTGANACTFVDRSTTKNLWYMESCDQLLPFSCEMIPCPAGTFQCSNGRCVGQDGLCDGVDQCGDLSDERNCQNSDKRCTYYYYGTSGSIHSPKGDKFLEYPAKATCTWIIQGPPGTRVQLMVKSFATADSMDYVEVWVGGATVSESLCALRMSGSVPDKYQSFVSTNNFVIVRMVTDSTNQTGGFTFTWRTDFQCEMIRLKNMRPSPGHPSGEITIPGGSDVTYCTQQCSSKSSCMGFRHNLTSRKCDLVSEVIQPISDECCDVYVKTCPGQSGLPVLSSMPNTGGTVIPKSFGQQIYTPLYPVFYPGDMDIAWIIQSEGRDIITVEVQDVHLCGSDMVMFKDGGGPSSVTLMTLTSASTAGDVTMSTGNKMYVFMKLMEHMKCRGVLFTYRSGCTFDLTSDNGTIYTPGYGVKNHVYPDLLVCSWKLKSSSGRPLQLKFIDFKTQPDKDYLKIYDGADHTGKALHKGRGYSGETPPTIQSADSGLMFVEFTTSAYQGNTGFKAVFSSGCQDLTSPNIVVSPRSSNIRLDDSIMITCKQGYFSINPYTKITCKVGGQYSGAIPVCEQSYCGHAPIVKNSYVSVATGTQGGDNVTYACDSDAGYTMEGEATVTCLGDGSWTSPPNCTALSCTAPSSIDNGTFTYVFGDLEHGSIVKYSCQTNYQLIGRSTVTCKNGVWSPSTPVCERKQCGKQRLQDGMLSVKASDTVYFGDIITVTCNAGYELRGKSPYICGVDTQPRCIDKNECSQLPSPCKQGCTNYNGGYSCYCYDGFTAQNADASSCADINECLDNNGYCDHDCVNTDGSYHCICLEEFVLYSHAGFNGLTLQKGENGLNTWDSYHINHSCVYVQCPAPAVLPANSHQRALTTKAVFIVDDTIEYLCDIGYVTSDTKKPSRIITCQKDGTWSASAPTCEEVLCDRRGVDPGITVSPTEPIRHGQAYIFTCIGTGGATVSVSSFCTFFLTTQAYRLNTKVCPYDCNHTPCMNGGVCVPLTSTTFKCNCPAGFKGDYCQLLDQTSVCTSSQFCGDQDKCRPYYPRSDNRYYKCLCPNRQKLDNSYKCVGQGLCNSIPCNRTNGGKCYEEHGRWECSCDAPYGRRRCDDAYKSCFSQPCKNRGLCTNLIAQNSFKCSCPAGTTGATCESIDECSSSPCDTLRTKQCYDLPNDFYCDCKEGFYGKTCSEGSPCDSDPCQHGGTCKTAGLTYQCSCKGLWIGTECQTEPDMCKTNPCRNGGQCYNQVSGFTCVCLHNYTGETCQTPYDLCTLVDPCVGPGSKCLLSQQGEITCSCESGYKGRGCNEPTVRCENSSCLNGGICQVVDQSIKCTCAAGFSGDNCAINKNECSPNPCTGIAKCVDGINSYMCICPSDKTGDGCYKDFTYDFDVVLQSRSMCGSQFQISDGVLFSLGGHQLSVSLWVRFTGQTSTTDNRNIVSVYGLANKDSSPVQLFLIRSLSTSVKVSFNEYTTKYGQSLNIQDGLWHHILVTWNGQKPVGSGGLTGRMTIYVDNKKVGQADGIGTNSDLPAKGMVIFGGYYENLSKEVVRSLGMLGRISRLYVIPKELAAVDVDNLYKDKGQTTPSSALRYGIENMGLSLDYNSEVTSQKCFTVESCVGSYDANKYPQVTSCPDDQLILLNRSNAPSWPQPQYNGKQNRVLTNQVSGAAKLNAGVYGVSFAGFDANDNAAICTFRLFIRSAKCSSLGLPKPGQENPVRGVVTCISGRCHVTCRDKSEQPYLATPTYHTCSKYGHFDTSDRVDPYIYPACSKSEPRREIVETTVTYDLQTTCTDTSTANIRTKFTKSLSHVNTVWGSKLCTESACRSEVIDVSCLDLPSTKMSVTVKLNSVLESIQSGSQIKSPRDIMMAAVDNGDFSNGEAVPDVMTLNISSSRAQCKEGFHIVGQNCVECGAGSYYSGTDRSCKRCPKGQYQDLSGQKFCKNCPLATQTTWEEGAASADNCYTTCKAGHYYTLTQTPGTCEDCDIGYYQSQAGMIHCVPCDVQQTTSATGATDANQCLSESQLTTANTSAPVAGPNQGASMAEESSDGVTAALIILCILIIVIIVIIIIVCICKDKIPFLSGDKVTPEESTYSARFGEPQVEYVTYRLSDVRERRGVVPLQKRPTKTRRQMEPMVFPDETGSYHTDMSVTLPKYSETVGDIPRGNRLPALSSGVPPYTDWESGIKQGKKSKKVKKTKKPKRLSSAQRAPRDLKPLKSQGPGSVASFTMEAINKQPSKPPAPDNSPNFMDEAELANGHATGPDHHETVS